MTRVGLVGGLGPESTIGYYRRILETWQRADPASSPAIVIVGPGDVAGLPVLDATALHVEAIVRRLRGGAGS